MTSWDNKLKPCPFCGGDADMVTVARAECPYRPHEVFVSCNMCGVKTPVIVVRPEYCAYDKAVEAWNRRATNETV